MPNINKVVYGGTTLIDLTDSTLNTANQIANGVTAYDRSGTKLTGTLVVDTTYSVTKNLTDVSSSSDDTKVIAGNSFFTELTPASGYVISSITVTMGGVDITDQVFKPGVGAKAITANGTYNAEDDNLSGYSSVVVNVPTGSASLDVKSISSNGTYNASSDNLDGYSQVTVNVPNTYVAGDEGKVVSNGSLVAQTSSSVTQNGTVDTTLINSLLVSVSGSGKQYKTGTFTPTATTTATGNVEITTTSTIGFTPKVFVLAITNKSDVQGVGTVLVVTAYIVSGGNDEFRFTGRYSNTSNSFGGTMYIGAWTTQQGNALYLNNGKIYYRASTNYRLIKDKQYTWYAYE